MSFECLEQLLGETSSQVFIDSFLGKRWLHCKAATRPAPFGELATLRDLELLLFDGDRRENVLLAVGGLESEDGKDTPNHRCSAGEGLDEWASGKSLVFNGIDSQLPAVHALRSGLEGELKCRIGCNLYLTPARGHGLRTHYDPHDVFVLQLRGSKQWRVGARAADSPMAFLMSESFPPMSGECTHILMQAGDVLYLPRGTLHDAVAADELSCHLTIGLHPKTYLDAILAAVTLAAGQNPKFREHLPLGSSAIAGYVAAEAQRLLGLVSAENFREAGEAFRELLVSQKRRSSIGLLELRGESEPLSDSDYFRAVPHLICSLSRHADGIKLHAMGKSITLPASAADDVGLCCSGKPFRLEDLQSAIEARASFVRRLMFEGLVHRLAPDDELRDVPADIVWHASASLQARSLTALTRSTEHGK